VLPKKFRLTRKKDFEKISRKGKHFGGAFFILRTIENGLDYSRFGFVVSLKVSKKAVTRNKIRRQLHEMARVNFARIKNGFDALIIARPEIKEKSYQEIERALFEALEKGELLT
jgi:ribonuclease P protein component